MSHAQINHLELAHQYEVTYTYRTPMGWRQLVDETGEPVVDLFSAEREAHASALRGQRTLQLMDTSWGWVK